MQYGVVVLHGETDRTTFEQKNHKPVAAFTFDLESTDPTDAAEAAFMATQNLSDSWSFAGLRDAHESLILLQPHPVYDGRELGHRSSMTGDIFLVTVDGSKPVLFRAEIVGYTKVK
jgi:hypothetical protein